MDRRSLLKWFGAGAIIAPVADGSPVLSAQARIVEPPKVEPVAALEALTGKRTFPLLLVLDLPDGTSLSVPVEQEISYKAEMVQYAVPGELWLRCEPSFGTLHIKAAEKPQIRRL